MSGISYTMLQKAGPKATRRFLKLVNMVLKYSIFPRRWKVGQIFPISKMSEWNFSLASTRPIMLLEIFRKSLVRIVQKRLSKVFLKHNILRGLNFAGLPGNSTGALIYTLSNILEEAKEERKELWILLQDIKKAFDSVPLESIRQACTRIKIPQEVTNFLLEIYGGRRVRVITKFGLSEGFEAEDGIDQGEVISPLVWRMIYDPLLCRIQALKKGYSMDIQKPSEPLMLFGKEKGLNISCLAFADDTTFIASTQSDLQDILDKANEFYCINNIDINPKKSKMVVVNSRMLPRQQVVKLGRERAEVKALEAEKAAHFLGVWITAKDIYKQCVNRLKKETFIFTSLVKNKQISIGQMKYLNNKVMLPQLEYRALICLLDKRACDKIHQPVLRFAKWKAGIASTMANSITNHKELL